MPPKLPKSALRSKTKGGFRRKKRRITPWILDNYWPIRRREVFSKLWRGYTPSWDIVDRLNQVEAPKPVNRWQLWLMASYMGIRRPTDLPWVHHSAGSRVPQGLVKRWSERNGSGVVDMAGRQRARRASAYFLDKLPTRKRRKRARKPKPPKKLHAPGLSMGRPPRRRRKRGQDVAMSPKQIAAKAMRERNRAIRVAVRRGADRRKIAALYGMDFKQTYRIAPASKNPLNKFVRVPQKSPLHKYHNYGRTETI